MTDTTWLPFAPESLKQKASRKAILNYASKLISNGFLTDADRNTLLQIWQNELVQEIRALGEQDRLLTLAAMFVLTDLVSHGWRLQFNDGGIHVTRPELQQDANPREEKQRIRKQLHISREFQLRSPATSSFIQSMERRHLYKGEFISIFSLMRDGSELFRQLQSLPDHPVKNDRNDAFRKIVDPYLQFVEADETCPNTGFQLLDIWRYFRHTWANPYSSVPGRWMPILVRDAATRYHAIIGIAALTSPVVQLNVRDNWIGWSPDAFVAQLRNNPSSQMARWLQNVFDEAIGEVYKTDFLESGTIKPGDIKKPKANVIETFEKLTQEEREKHHRFTKASEYKSAWVQASDKVDWPTHARSPLYKSKRADFLARFLKYRMLLNEYFGDKPTGSKLERLLKKAAGTELVRGALRKVKGDKIGISVADIAVCGALPPYNELLGGKLVAMLLASPEVVNAYKKRYEKSPSIIASSMAGRPIVRAPSLALLCTTSLFAVVASQYNRIKIPCEVAGGKPGESIEYFKIGKSAGFGTHQFSPSTLEMLTNVVTQSTNGLRVNNVFGEGVNPKLRLLRQGLDELGLSSEAFLVHGSPRIVYGISLASNFKRYLLGLEKKPKYNLSMRNPKETSKKIIEWWYERWLSRRILNPDVMTRLTEHNFVHPIKHGARVPRLEDFTQPSLFDDV